MGQVMSGLINKIDVGGQGCEMHARNKKLPSSFGICIAETKTESPWAGGAQSPDSTTIPATQSGQSGK
jgi:hypothetical protein